MATAPPSNAAAALTGDIRLDERGNGVVSVVLDRPAKLNALTQAMCRRLAEVMTALSARDDVRCIVLRGAGRAFCPGADIGEFAEARSTIPQARAFNDVFHGAVDTVEACPHPVVAAIRGACVGGGLQLACACDLRIAASDARFGVPVNRLGLAVDYRELAPIVRIGGEAAALEFLLTGRVFEAERTRALGLVNHVVAPDALDAAVDETVAAIIGGAPLVNRWHKRFIRRLGESRPLTDAEREEPLACFETADYREGWRAFLEKRPPRFLGR